VTRVVDPILKELRESLLRMGSLAEAILDKSLRAVLETDPDLARQVEKDDLEIDRLDVEIDAAVLRALALQAPVADDLRGVVAVKMAANDLERVGDLARNIAKSALRLAGQVPARLPAGLARLASAAQGVLRRALDSYSESNARVAREVLDSDDRIDAAQDEVVRAALAEISADPDRASVCVDLILIAKNLERVGDHATNIAEDVILVTEARNVKHAEKLRA